MCNNFGPNYYVYSLLNLYFGVIVVFVECNLRVWFFINPLNAELNPICYLLALLEVHHFIHISRIRVNE